MNARLMTFAVIEGRDLPQLGRFADNDSFRVELSFGDLPLASTKLQKKHQSVVLWNKAFTLYVLSNPEPLLSVTQETFEPSFFSGQMPEFVLEVHGKSSMLSRVQFIGRTRVSHTDLGLNETVETGTTLIMLCHLWVRGLILCQVLIQS